MTWVRWTIKRKLLALGAGTLLPLLLLLAFWVWWEVREHTRQAEEELALASQQAAGQVRGVVESLTQHLRILAREPAVQRRQAGRMEALFRDVQEEHPEVENIFASAADGLLIASAVPPPGGAPVTAADRPWFQRILATGAPAVGGYQIGRIVGQPVAIVAFPLRDGEGRVSGVLGASLSLRRLHALFEPLPLAGSKTITVVEGEGRVLSRAPGAEGWIGRRLPSSAAVPPGPPGVIVLTGLEGGPLLVGVAPIPGTDWRVLAGIPQASLDARVWKEVRGIAVPLLGVLALSSLLGLLIARRVWRPLQELTEAARGLPQGTGHVPIRVDSSDEVGELARAFNAMATQVAESRSRLERQVAELTALGEAGRVLTSTLKLPEVLQRLAELARARLGADVVRIWLRDSPTGSLVLRSHEGVMRQDVEFERALPQGVGLAGWIMTHRAPLVLADVQEDPRLHNRVWIEAEGIVSFLGVPLLRGEESRGVLACLSRSRRVWSSEEVTLAEILASHAAIAIENARLVAELEAALEDLKAAQEKLVRDEALRAVGEMASGIAHHLNNLLAVVLGRIQLLLPTVRAPEIRRALQIMERAALDGSEVVRRVVRFAAAAPLSEPVPVNLNQLAREALELTRPRWQGEAQLRGIPIAVSLEPAQIPSVSGEAVALREVLVNLVFNAIEALPEGGRITVRTWAAEGRVHCSVADTGTGMPEEVRGRVMDPFFTTKGPRSRGLGLSLSHGIIRRHGGELAVESAEGRGTTVTLSLPVAPATTA